MPQFEVSTFGSQLLWLFVIFGALYVIVSLVIAPKAESILGFRNRYLDDNIGSAEIYNNKALLLREEKDKKLKELNIEIETFRQNAINILNNEFLSKRVKLNSVLSEKTQESLSEIQKYTNSFRKEEAKHCINLAAFIIEKITSRSADLILLDKIHRTK